MLEKESYQFEFTIVHRQNKIFFSLRGAVHVLCLDNRRFNITQRYKLLLVESITTSDYSEVIIQR